MHGHPNIKKVLKLSTLRTGRLYPLSSPRDTLRNHLCQRLCRPQGRSAARRITSTKNCNDNIGNRTRDLPACSPVSQATAHPVPQTKQSQTKTKVNRLSEKTVQDLAKNVFSGVEHLHQMQVTDQLHASAALLQKNKCLVTIGRLRDSQSWSARCGEKNNFLSLLVIELRLFVQAACRLVANTK